MGKVYCATCKREEWVKGVQFQEGRHCPDSLALKHQERDEVACLTAGIAIRDVLLEGAQNNFRRLLRSIDDLYDVTPETLEVAHSRNEEADGG